MAYFLCNNGGASSSGLSFEKTLLGTGKSGMAESVITLKEDYHNYDLIWFDFHDSQTTSNNSPVLTSVDLLDEMISLDSTDNIFKIAGTGGTNYAYIKKDSNTQFTRQAAATGTYGYVTSIIGVKLDYTSKSILYDRETPGTPSVTPTISDIEDYDILFFLMGSDPKASISPIYYPRLAKVGIVKVGSTSNTVTWNNNGLLRSNVYYMIQGYKL